MKKVFFVAILLVIVISGSIFFLSRKGPINSTQKPQPTTVPVVKSHDEAIVTITSKGFIPSTLQIKQGTRVKWKNTDKNSHQIISGTRVANKTTAEFESKALEKGDIYTFTFEKTGSFSYYDQLNPSKLHGTIVVVKE